MQRSAEEILKNRYKKQNDYNKANYQRITVLAPPGTAERVKALGVKSVSKFALELLLAELERRERSADQDTPTPETDQEPKQKITWDNLAEMQKSGNFDFSKYN